LELTGAAALLEHALRATARSPAKRRGSEEKEELRRGFSFMMFLGS
jgi:hypothetical protein